MAEHSTIEWTDATWNPVTGCSVVSPGCTNCYAMGLAGTRLRNHPSRVGLTTDSKAGPVWNGQVRLNEDWLLQPLRWKRPRMIFVCAHGDLFHESVPDEWIDRVFAVMAMSPHHTFQVLTKRAKRMREYCSDPATPFRVAKAMDAIKPGAGGAPDEEIREIAGYPGYFASSLGLIYTEHRGPRRPMKPDVGEQGHSRVQLHREGAGRYGDRHLVHRLILETFVGPAPSPDSQGRHCDGNAKNNALHNLTWGTQEENWTDAKRHGSHRRYSKLTIDQAEEIKRRHGAGETGESLAREFEISATQVRNIAAGRQWNVGPTIEWPLRNVWKGVSAEDQTRADERVPDLLATPAAVRFVSAEPLLGPIDFSEWMKGRAHGDSKERRGNRVPARACGGTDDRPRGADMAPFGATSGSLDREDESHPLRGTAASGTRHREISHREGDDRREADDGLRTQASLAPFQRPDPERVDSQSQGRSEEDQSSVELGTSDTFRTDDSRDQGLGLSTGAQLSWVIVGGESGPSARPMHPDWPRAIRDQCAAAGVPFFFKQHGEFAAEGLCSEKWIVRADGSHVAMPTPDGIGHHAPQNGSAFVYRVGKARAGRMLDGRIHDDMPARRP